MIESRPTFTGFSPDVIPYQRAVLDLIKSFDYSKGNPEILLSGSYGSAKSTLLAHLVVRHCLKNRRARVALARRAMPDLKRTIWSEVLEHIGDDFIEGVHFTINRATNTLTWANGSEIICLSWADGLYKKFRSLKLSMLVVEEIVENDIHDREAFMQIKARIRRLPHVTENVLIAATNPDAPGHWVHKYFIDSQDDFDTRHVFYSRTEDNIFLDPVYIQQLKRDLSPKEAERYLEGRWVEIAGETVYYEYRTAEQYRRSEYTVDPSHPVILSWDFNIAQGKPMSMLVSQYINDEFHCFDQVVVEGARTADTMDELNAKGLLRTDWKYKICGDASGRNRDTRSQRSDYSIITEYMERAGLGFEYCVPVQNPPIRTRHNRVNAYCRNAIGHTRLWVYSKAKTLDEGLRLVKLKAGANYLEDDGPGCPFQHITTALGYMLCFVTTQSTRQEQRTRIL